MATMRKRRNITEKQYDDKAAALLKWVSESVSPFENDTPEKQTARIARSEHDQLYFFKKYLPHYFTVDFAPFHSEWAEISEVMNHVFLAVVPREHAKSTFWSFGVPLHNIVYAKRWFNILGSDTNDLATDFVMALKAEIEGNHRIRHDFGDLIGSPWTSSNFVTANGVRCWARGFGEPVRGRKHRQHRPDYICLDDLENDQTVRSPKQTQNRVDWIKSAVLGSMSATGLMVYAQNMFSPRSAIAQMVAEVDEAGDQRYDSCVLAAIIDHDTPDERPLWPALWPMKRLLAKIKQIGLKAFLKEFMNRTESEDAEFKSALVKYYDDHLSLPQDLAVASFCDPSAKNAKKNDFKAIVTIGLDRKAMIFYILHAWIQHGSVTGMLNACQAAVERVISPGRPSVIIQIKRPELLALYLISISKESSGSAATIATKTC
ncbi:MAG: hypothetical protein JRC99_00135 [Deltaproteobacteria bacterium]|nr:hypothetical protein [Deltaproteobacteria bacterium]